MATTGPSTETMRGWAISGYGDEIVLMDDLPVPTPGPRDVLIKMLSAEVGIWDELVRTGACDVERPFPLVLGLGGAGTIVAVGAQVKDFAEGQYVYAYSYPLANNGSWAQYMLVPDNYVARVPTSIAPMEAGGLPVAGSSAHEALIDLLGVKEDEIVLVSAGAGGVGHIAVQIASLFGARVGATASRRNQDFLADLGAEAVIDYTEQDDLAKAIRAVFPGGVDKVLNCVRGEDANDYVWVLKDGGKMVDLAGAVSVDRPAVEIISNHVMRGNGARLAELARLFDDGALQVAIHDMVPFADARDALDEVLTGHVRGKVVLRIT
jgi:NADPH:quinone reductase-like Zn-dependent oxidoreductase